MINIIKHHDHPHHSYQTYKTIQVLLVPVLILALALALPCLSFTGIWGGVWKRPLFQRSSEAIISITIGLHRFTSLHRIDNEQTHNLRSLPHGWGGEPGVVNVRGEGQMVVDTLDNIDFNWIKISRVFNILDRAGRLDGSWHSTGCHSLVVLRLNQDILI